MSTLRTLIIDDEPLARERVRSLLAKEPGFEIVAEYGNGAEAIAGIIQHAPDVVLIDVQMPGCDGLQVIQAIPPERRPAVLFVTAHERFAVDAFAIQAVDYLLKPFDRERLKVALQRAAEFVRNRRAGGAISQVEAVDSASGAGSGSARRLERFAVKADGKVVFVRPEDVIWIEAADNYVLLHLADRRLMLRETLSALETRLGTAGFARVNRSALVRIDQVRELQPTFHGDYVVVLRDGTQLPLSRSLRGQLERFTGEGS